MTFAVLDHPPAAGDPDRPAWWYLVREGELLVSPSGEVPTGTSPAAGRGFGLGAGAGPVRAGGIGPVGAAADTDPLFMGTMAGDPCWAVGVAPGTEAPDGSRWVGLRALGGLLSEPAWKAAARAVHLVDWYRTSRYCGRCGSATEASGQDRSTRCPACGLPAYPRVTPAIIVAVHRDRQLLLARNGRFRSGMFSVLAGFVEPGETLEDTVHREVAEEVGVRLTDLRYAGSQPWPFPHSLMVGFTAAWASGDIRVDGVEIHEAHWFDRDRLPELPPPVSIARRLIEQWRAGGT